MAVTRDQHVHAAINYAVRDHHVHAQVTPVDPVTRDQHVHLTIGVVADHHVRVRIAAPALTASTKGPDPAAGGIYTGESWFAGTAARQLVIRRLDRKSGARRLID